MSHNLLIKIQNTNNVANCVIVRLKSVAIYLI